MTASALYLSLIIGMLASGLCVLARRRLLSQLEIIACLAGGALGGVFAAYLVGPVMVLSRNDILLLALSGYVGADWCMALLGGRRT